MAIIEVEEVFVEVIVAVVQVIGGQVIQIVVDLKVSLVALIAKETGGLEVQVTEDSSYVLNVESLIIVL